MPYPRKIVLEATHSPLIAMPLRRSLGLNQKEVQMGKMIV